MNRLAIVSTHPIQYNAPLFRMLAEESCVHLKVFYTRKAEDVRFDPDFGQNVVWDVPLTEGYTHESFGASSRQGLAALLSSIEAFRPKAILVYGWNFPGHFKVMRHFRGTIKVWFRGDSTLIDPMPLWKKALRKMWLTWVYRHIDLAFYVGSANKRYFEWAGLSEDQFVLAPHAVDNEYFMRDDEAKRAQALELRQSLGISPTAAVFLFVGKLEPKKQPVQLARAFLQLSRDEPNREMHLVYIGTGVLDKQLKTEFGGIDNIHMLGFINQSKMPIHYRLGNFVCLPSIGPGETWGLVINEAMACGCYGVVSNRVGCSEDMITDESVGAVVLHSTEDAIASALRNALSINSNRETIQKHVARWSFDEIARKMLEELHRLS